MQKRDIRGPPLYQEIAAFYEQLPAPGTGRVTDAADITVRPDGAAAAFTGSIYQDMQTPPVTRICTVDLASSRLEVRPGAEGNDKMPRWSPDRTRMAFLSDRLEPGNYQLYLCDGAADSAALATPAVEGT